MNNGFYKDLDTNFEQACVLCEQTFSHAELVNMLISGNIPQKQIAALKFDKVETEEDAKALLNNLTGCDGKIREAVALKIYQVICEDLNSHKLFSSTSSIYPLKPTVFADATIDINANICRLVVDSVRILKPNTDFAKEYTENILKYTLQALDELDKFIFRDKKYVINKQLFKLYWCLEALKYFFEMVDENTMLEILKRSSAQNEYTVREKAAEIAVLSEKFKCIQKELENDSNYYVRAVFLNH